MIDMGIGDWGLGIGDWGLGPMGPIPNPQSPIPNPQAMPLIKLNKLEFYIISINSFYYIGKSTNYLGLK